MLQYQDERQPFRFAVVLPSSHASFPLETSITWSVLDPRPYSISFSIQSRRKLDCPMHLPGIHIVFCCVRWKVFFWGPDPKGFDCVELAESSRTARTSKIEREFGLFQRPGKNRCHACATFRFRELVRIGTNCATMSGDSPSFLN